MEDFEKNYRDSSIPPPPKFEWKYLIYTFLIISQVATWGLIIFDKNRTRETFQAQEKKILSIDSAKRVIQKMYDASIIMLNEKTSENARLDSIVKSKDNEIFQLKESITAIISKKTLTQKEIDAAKSMVKQMTEKVSTLSVQNEPLKTAVIKPVAENKPPETENSSVKTVLKNEITNPVLTEVNKPVAKENVFTASQIQLIPITVKGSGKEIATNKASRANVMRIDFNLAEIKSVNSGTKNLVICFYNPDDKLIMLDEKGWETFTTQDGEEKVYSVKVTINYIQGQTQNVSIDWKQPEKYEPGTYRIEIYHNGFLIGKGSVQLKKSTGLFG